MRNETDWAYLPQSEERVVAKQIKERSRQDAAYAATSQCDCVQQTDGGFGISESIQCTYIDLMRQIELCDFPQEQQMILEQLMQGYSLRDIAEEYEMELREVEKSFRNAVYHICSMNEDLWKETYCKDRES